MKQQTNIKGDDMYHIKTRLIFSEELGDHYIGTVSYYDGDMYLYSETTKIARLNEMDARYDAERLAEDH